MQLFNKFGKKTPSKAAQQSDNTQNNLHLMWEKYKEPEQNFMGQKGITLFFNDLAIDLQDPLVQVFSFLCQAQKMGRYEENEFKKGAKSLGSQTIEDQKKKKNYMSETYLKNTKNFKDLYRWTCLYQLGPSSKMVDMKFCRIMWKILLQGKYPLSDLFQEFVNKDCEETHIAKDQWNMVLDFLINVKADQSTFSENDAWPLYLFDFVDWIKNDCKKVDNDF